MANLNAHVSAIGAIRRLVEYARQDAFMDSDGEEIDVRLERLEQAWTRFNEIHTEMMEALVAGDMDEAEQAMIDTEALYDEAKTAFRRRLVFLRQQELAAQAEIAGHANQQPQIAVQVQMPVQQHDMKNTWGEFDGSLTKWQGFHDRFVAAIHDNEQVSPAFKFLYLKKSLTGKAARTMGEWQLTDDNYHEAWERLKQLYNKKYPICRELLRQFIRLPPLQQEPRSDDLQRMSNTTHETLRQLKAQGLPVEQWDMFVVHMLHDRLDSETAKQWELQRQSETPTAAQMLEFLDKQAAAISNINSERRFRHPDSDSKERLSRHDSGRFNRLESERASKRLGSQQRNSAASTPSKPKTNAPAGSSTPARRHKCEACNDEHQLFSCEQFKALSLRARKEFVHEKQLCENCLKRGHNVDSCFQQACPRCPGELMHNSVLCPTRDTNRPAAVLKAERASGSKRRTA